MAIPCSFPPISSGEGSSPCRAAAARCRRGGASGGWGPSSAPSPPTTTASPSPPHRMERRRRWRWWDRSGRICRGVAPTIPNFPTSAGGRLEAARGGEGELRRTRWRTDAPAVASNCQRQAKEASAPSRPFQIGRAHV